MIFTWNYTEDKLRRKLPNVTFSNCPIIGSLMSKYWTNRIQFFFFFLGNLFDMLKSSIFRFLDIPMVSDFLIFLPLTDINALALATAIGRMGDLGLMLPTLSQRRARRKCLQSRVSKFFLARTRPRSFDSLVAAALDRGPEKLSRYCNYFFLNQSRQPFRPLRGKKRRQTLRRNTPRR